MNANDRDIRDDIAENERWLSGFETPSASRELLDSIKQSMRTELARGKRPSRRRWSAWQGAVASAAMILLAVGVGWMSTQGGPRGDHEQVVQVDADDIANIFRDMSVGDDYADWSSTSDDAWTVSATALYDDLEAAMWDGDADGTDNTGAFLPAGSDGRWVEEIG